MNEKQLDSIDGSNRALRTVSHTLTARVADKLRLFAFRERISESAIIEFALDQIFEGSSEHALSAELKASGATLRRRVKEQSS